MEDFVWAVLGVGVVLLPFYVLFRNTRKIQHLEYEMRSLQRRMLLLESTHDPQPSTQADASTSHKTFAPHQLSTLIDLEALKTQVSGTPEPLPSEIEQQQAFGANTADSAAQSTAETASAQTESTGTESMSAETASENKTESKTKTSREWEAFVGGRVFNRIGAAAIILGIGFFLKYAFDNDLIPEWLRVGLGLLAGAGLIAGAERARKRSLEIFAQGLVGAGIAALYLSVYAAHNFYHLIPVPVAFGGMIGVTACGFLLALRFDSLAIALLAWFGGFLTPLLFHTETPNPVALFSYLLFLNLGLLALVFMRDAWFILKPLSFCATYLIALLWYNDQYATLQHFTLATVFAALYWAVFFFVDVFRAAQGLSLRDALWRKADGLLNSSVSYTALFVLIDDAHQMWMPLCSILYGSAYCSAAYLVLRRQPLHTFAFARYTLVGIVQMVFATAQAFNAEWTIILWSFECAALMWAGMRWKRTFVSVAGIALSVVVFVYLLLWQSLTGIISAVRAFLNAGTAYSPWETLVLPLIMYASGTAALVWIAVLFPRLKEQSPYVRNLRLVNIFHPAWGLVVISGLFFILRYMFSFEQSLDMVRGEYRQFQCAVIAMACCAGMFVWIARRKQWAETLWTGILLGAMTAFVGVARGFSYMPATEWMFGLNLRVAGLLALIIMTISVFRDTRESDAIILPQFRTALRAFWSSSILVLVFTLLSGEASDLWHSQIMRVYEIPGAGTTFWERIRDMENAKQLTISLVWLAYAIVLMALGLVRRKREIRLASLGLAGIAIGKIFLYDLSYLSTPYRIGSFIGLGVVLMAVSYLYQRYKHIILDE